MSNTSTPPKTIELETELVVRIGKLLVAIATGQPVDIDDVVDLSEDLYEQLPELNLH